MRPAFTATLAALITLPTLHAQQLAPIPRRLPPEGIDLPAADRERLQARLDELTARFESARSQNSALAPDVEIYLKAVSYALAHNEFYNVREIPQATEALDRAENRLEQLAEGKSPWTGQRGLLVRGYRSALDDSVQPYGLDIPDHLDLTRPVPLYVWLHGRGDKTTDLHFIHGRERSVGTISPSGAIVLHPFGRHCNAFKFAGEVDVFEAIASVIQRYPIDPDRIVLWGFSMGGAGAWHLGAHHPDRWAAVSPGAGFAETRRYQNIQPRDYPPTYEQTLWNLFDVPSYVRNFFNVPVVAYSGEVDKQIQAARVMEEAFADHGTTLTHLIGPGMGHRYHPDTLAELAKRMQGFAAAGINHFPRSISFQTRTLRYNRCHWVEVLALDEHWCDSRVDAALAGEQKLELTTRNVTAIKLTDPRPDGKGFERGFAIAIDGQVLEVAASGQTQPAIVLEKAGGRWGFVDRFPSKPGLRKRHGLQGPIDDVFMEPFLVVVPSGTSAHPAVERWVQFESAHLLDRWKALFRGDTRVQKDVEVTAEDVERFHLILWGDRSSNRLIEQVADHLPIAYSGEWITAGRQSFSAADHILSMIHPNPLAPHRYVVLNSGMTFREGHDRTNSLQNPKLPDWAVVDLSQPPNQLSPGRIAAAGFFGEDWRLR